MSWKSWVRNPQGAQSIYIVYKYILKQILLLYSISKQQRGQPPDPLTQWQSVGLNNKWSWVQLPQGSQLCLYSNFFFINKKTQDIAKYAWMPEWSKGGDSRSSVIATRRFEPCSKYYTHLAQWQSAWLLTWWSQVQSLRWVSKQQIQQNKLEFNLTRGVRIPSVHSARAGKYLLLCKKNVLDTATPFSIK